MLWPSDWVPYLFRAMPLYVWFMSTMQRAANPGCIAVNGYEGLCSHLRHIDSRSQSDKLNSLDADADADVL